jgi:hypothetical protein
MPLIEAVDFAQELTLAKSLIRECRSTMAYRQISGKWDHIGSLVSDPFQVRAFAYADRMD